MFYRVNQLASLANYCRMVRIDDNNLTAVMCKNIRFIMLLFMELVFTVHHGDSRRGQKMAQQE